jgi:GNAT superfamily N-acetyltransferase
VPSAECRGVWGSRVLHELDPAATVAAIEGNIEALCASFAAIPGATVEDRPEGLRYAAPVPSPMFNGVARVRLAPESVDGAIAAARAFFAARGQPRFFWWAGPATEPSDLGARLLAAGFAPSWDAVPGMARDLASLPADPATPPAFAIERVADPRALATWGRVFNAIFAMPEWAGRSWVEATRRAGLARARWCHYLGLLDGAPVATATLVPGAGVAGLYNVGVLPAARRLGIGAAITLAPLRDARALGYGVGILHASPEGDPLYRRLGFREYCRVSRFVCTEE